MARPRLISDAQLREIVRLRNDDHLRFKQIGARLGLTHVQTRNAHYRYLRLKFIYGREIGDLRAMRKKA
jgi:hypothetical protein